MKAQKKHIKFIAYSISLVFILNSCLKKEIAVDKHQIGNVIVSQINMSYDYKKQIYFDLETNKIVKTNLKTDWDLGFECQNDKFHIKLNSSRGMKVARIKKSDFTEITDTNGLSWRWDNSSGKLDSTAFGNWKEDNFIYVLDMGYDLNGNAMGIKKIQIIDANNTFYNIKYGNLNNTLITNFSIPIDSEKNYVSFSLISNSIVEIEPKKTLWDLKFTQYTHLFSPTFAYTVTGVLTNPYGTKISQLDSVNFDEINLEYISKNQIIFNTNMDEIGYDWKYYSMEENSFTIINNRVYLILTQEGYYYKLRFIDFYDEQGQKGNPKFEFQRL